MSASIFRTGLQRRELLLAGAALGLGAAAAGCSRAPSALSVSELADGLILVAGPAGNVLARKGPEGAVLVDSGHADYAADLLKTVKRALGVKRVAAVLNTHWHLEASGGNDLMAAQGATIMAQEATRLWMGTTIYQRWSETTFPPRAPEARPTQSFYREGRLELGGAAIDYAHQRGAHTDGDIWVRFPDANVIAAGGITTGAGWPIIDWSTDGWIGGMIDGIGKLIELSDDATRIVPAEGPVLSKADLVRQKDMYKTILDRMWADVRASHDLAEIAAASPTAEFDAEMGDPALFIDLAMESIWLYLRSDPRVSTI